MRAFRRAFIHFGIVVCSVLFALLCAEVGIRVYDLRVRQTPFFLSRRDLYDRELGWTGKKIFGDPSSNKQKIFLVGDSFTYGYGAPEDGVLYHGVLGQALGAEMFVYGGVGYGTLQEYLVIDRYLDEIKPDLILLQAHANDLINNAWALERRSYYNNNREIRPYLENERIVYRYPRGFGAVVEMLSCSRLVSFLRLRIEQKLAVMAREGRLISVEHEIARAPEKVRGFRESVDTTQRIIKQIKARAGGIPVVAFTTSRVQPYYGQLQKIFAANGIGFIEEVPLTIEREKGKGAQLFYDGAHWNAQGHELVGRVLADAIRSRWEAGGGP